MLIKMNRFDLQNKTDEEVKLLADSGNYVGIFEYAIRMYNQDRYKESFEYFYKIKDWGNFIVWEYIIKIAYYYEKDALTDKELFDFLIKRHNYGSSFYSYILAYFYRDGRGTRKSLRKYIELLTICSHDGSANATIELAECYENGFGVKKSLKKAFDVYYHFVDDHCRMDYWCAYKVAYYMLHELGGAKKDMPSIEYHLRYAARVHEEARRLYRELFNKEPE